MNPELSETERKPAELSPLYMLARRMCEEPGGFDRYDYAKSVWLGNPDRLQRLAGEHPWPTRIRNGERYVYSVPVFAGVDVESQRLLYIGKDNWKPADDPNAWLVAERGLLGGDEIEHPVLSAHVDAARQLRLRLTPEGFGNLPPLDQQAIRGVSYDQMIFFGRLGENYNLREVQLRDGLDGRIWHFDDIEELEKMIVGVQQLEAMERNPEAFAAELQTMGGYALVGANV